MIPNRILNLHNYYLIKKNPEPRSLKAFSRLNAIKRHRNSPFDLSLNVLVLYLVLRVFLVNLYAIYFLWILNCLHNYCESMRTKVNKAVPLTQQIITSFHNYFPELAGLIVVHTSQFFVSSQFHLVLLLVIPHNPITQNQDP